MVGVNAGAVREQRSECIGLETVVLGDGVIQMAGITAFMGSGLGVEPVDALEMRRGGIEAMTIDN